MENEKKMANCAQCPIEVAERLCKKEDGKAPAGCPTKHNARSVTQAMEVYRGPFISEFARQASIQESEGYGNKELGYDHLKPVKPRILEIAEFARKMNYHRLGLVFCVGLRQEAQKVGALFEKQGFEVVSVICKVGRVPKESIGLTDDQKLSPGHDEAMCNPVAQAFVLNEAKTDFNILLGLCVGHDSLLFKHAEALCTVLAAKDRLLGHNPMAAVYLMDSYYRDLKNT
ncbi:MAG: DUF1847 domain-containing protein [Desulfohalobiaceae bacterium]|nr:DUF1847 domain-containing protein [Desulfohalobiaceae bacterium]